MKGRAKRQLQVLATPGLLRSLIQLSTGEQFALFASVLRILLEITMLIHQVLLIPRRWLSCNRRLFTYWRTLPGPMRMPRPLFWKPVLIEAPLSVSSMRTTPISFALSYL